MIAAYDKRRRLLAICLSGLSGYIDALGFLALGGLFVSFMSGNSTQMAVGLGTRSAVAGTAGGLIACFLVGVIVGAIVAARAGRRRKLVVLLWVALLLLGAAVLAELDLARWAPFVMAVAMGVMNSVFQRDGEVSVGVTYMTGTLVKMGHRIAAAFRGGPRWQWLPYFQLWLGLLGGALAGTWAYQQMGLAALWPASGGALLLALVASPLEAQGLDQPRQTATD